MQPQNYVIF